MFKRVCRRCSEEKPLDDFQKRANCQGGYRLQCKACDRLKVKQWKAANSERLRDLEAARGARRRAAPGSQRAQQLRTKYRLTLEQYGQLETRQGGRCGLCSRPDPGGKGNWHVDHDHACCPGSKSCGKCIRGLLCARCNPGLGFFDDSIALLEAAIAYLRAGARPLAA